MFKLNLVTPEKKIVMDQELEEIILPAFRGELHILPGHAPMLTTLGAGLLRYRLKGEEIKKLAVGWGYCQVSAQGVNVLAEVATEASDVDLVKANQAVQKIEKAMATEFMTDQQWEKITQDLQRLRAEISLAPKA
jgi:F-type H+-transporting ATPase subunit epsilon